MGLCQVADAASEDASRACASSSLVVLGVPRTHVLLPASMLVRRADDGPGDRLPRCWRRRPVWDTARSRCVLGRPMSTVRGWLRRFGGRAESVRVLFTGLLHALDATGAAATPTGSVFGDALDVLGLAAAAAARLFGPRPAWQFAASASGGLLLGPGVLPGPAPGGPHELTLGNRPRRRQPSALLITT